MTAKRSPLAAGVRVAAGLLAAALAVLTAAAVAYTAYVSWLWHRAQRAG